MKTIAKIRVSRPEIEGESRPEDVVFESVLELRAMFTEVASSGTGNTIVRRVEPIFEVVEHAIRPAFGPRSLGTFKFFPLVHAFEEFATIAQTFAISK